MTIKRKLILSPSLLLATFVAITTITWISGIHLTDQAHIARAFERQAMHLQKLFRGINETLLTSGTPNSIRIAEEALKEFEQTHGELLKDVSHPVLNQGMIETVEPKWRAIRYELDPFFVENATSIDDTELMVTYGGLLNEADALLAEVQKLSQLSQKISEDVARQTSLLVAATVAITLLGIFFLFFHLYRNVALPIDALKSTMQGITRGQHDLVDVIDQQSKELGQIEQMVGRNKNNEISLLSRASRIMLYSIRNHLVRRQQAESALSDLNKSLEQHVEARTSDLQISNKRLQTQISERIKGEQELRFAASIFDDTPDGILVTDERFNVLRVNDAFSKITGYEKAEVIGKDVDFDGDSGSSYRSTVEARLRDRDFWQGELQKQRKNGEAYTEWCKLRAIRNDLGKLLRYVFIFSDISEQKELEDQLHQLAHYDNLTSLPNRSHFQERLQEALFQTQRRRRGMALLFLDLDHFKVINDSLGHQIGDNLLELTATRLRECLRDDDIVARLGGDEFTVLLRDTNSPEDISKIAQSIIKKISEPALIQGHEIHTGTSVGISIYPGDGENVEALLRNADTAMYRAKKDGKGVARFFTPEMDAVTQRRLAIEVGLRKAVDKGEFELHYQPQIDVSRGKLFGVEALLRWNNDALGSVPPDEFISVAEETNLIGKIGKWVIERACAQYQVWQIAGYAPERIGVNLSPRQLTNPNLVEDIADILKSSDMPPSVLDLEITETAIMENPEHSIATLKRLTDLGIKCSIDDFGVEYSALNQLKLLPIDTLKIDRTFIMDIPEDSDDMAITSAIIAMAKSFGLSVIAEGIETKEQLNFLTAHDCHLMQGYYFSRPLPVAEVENLLAESIDTWKSGT